MRRTLLPLLALLLAVSAAPPARSQRSAGREGTGDPFSAFRAIAERNIFNPNRAPRTSPGRTAETPAGPADEVIALVGTLDYAKGVFALFEGTDPSQRKALQAGGRIAEWTITGIRQTEITLEQEGRVTRLPVGGHLRRAPGGPWSVSDAAAPLASAPTGSPSTAAAPPPAPGAPVDAAETLRRLREKRLQQLKE